MENIPFLKMHGLGNDFVIIDSRQRGYNLTPEMVKVIADRHKGVGCDQLVVLEKSSKAACKLTFYNADGSVSGACGNASRCVAQLIMQENGSKKVRLETKAGILECWRDGEKIAVNMGKATTEWKKIPLAEASDTMNLKITADDLKTAVAVNIGNPHAVFFVNDVNKVNLAHDGPMLENHRIFPERANINAAHVFSKTEIYLRVWERGAGETLACGSGACATAFASYKKGLTGKDVTVHLQGGDLQVQIKDDDTIIMIGDVTSSFSGEINGGILE